VAHVVEHLLKRYKTLSSTPVSKKKKDERKEKKELPCYKNVFSMEKPFQALIIPFKKKFNLLYPEKETYVNEKDSITI
jgi:hypothetical protein